MNLFLISFITGASFLLSFLLYFHPLKQNIIANKWLSLFVFIIGTAFTGTYMIQLGNEISYRFLFKILNSMQFLLAPGLYISILYFVNPTKVFRKIDGLHFIPFIIVITAEMWNYGKGNISTIPLFNFSPDKPFLLRDILPIVTCFYLVKLFKILATHKAKLKRITSNIDHINLDWVVQLLIIFSLSVVFWINDAMLGLPFISNATNFVHAGTIFFAAYFSIKQKTIFKFKEKDIKEISAILQNEDFKTEEKPIPEFIESTKDTLFTTVDTIATAPLKEKLKLKRLNAAQMESLSEQLSILMEKEKLFLDNDLDLPTVAEKLGISIHETSFLINEATKDNFYNFINKFRVQEAKRLLSTAAMAELNILGIAFASGFNSKTTFNTTFKRIVGVSPSEYSKIQKNNP